MVELFIFYMWLISGLISIISFCLYIPQEKRGPRRKGLIIGVILLAVFYVSLFIWVICWW